jgi:hypothetical protein
MSSIAILLLAAGRVQCCIGMRDGAWSVCLSLYAFSHTAKHCSACCRALANNMVIGVSEGWTKELQLIGVGYRATVNGSTLVLNLGFSHPVEMPIPDGIQVKVDLLDSWSFGNSVLSLLRPAAWPECEAACNPAL